MCFFFKWKFFFYCVKQRIHGYVLNGNNNKIVRCFYLLFNENKRTNIQIYRIAATKKKIIQLNKSSALSSFGVIITKLNERRQRKKTPTNKKFFFFEQEKRTKTHIHTVKLSVVFNFFFFAFAFRLRIKMFFVVSRRNYSH